MKLVSGQEPLHGSSPPPAPALASKASIQLRDYLPPFARDGFEKINLLDLGTRRNNKGRPEIVFRMGWTARSDEAKHKFQKIVGARQARCEGHCGKMKRAHEIVQFGLCDHNICVDCLRAAPHQREMYPGAHYCPHADCWFLHPPSPALIAQSVSSTSSSSVLSVVSSVLVEVFLFRLSPSDGHLLSTVWEMEVAGDTKTSQILEHVVIETAMPSLADCHLFYSTQQKACHRHLLPLLESEKTSIGRLTRGEHLSLVIVGPSVDIQSCRL